VPQSINGKKMSLVNLILNLNKIGGENGVGRVDMVENRLVGIKSREIYECPGAFKQIISQKYSELTYYGLWFSALKEALDGFVKVIKDKVTGTIKVKLFKGNCVVVGRKSKNSLYDFNLATYDQGDTFNQDFAKGFIELWGLPTKVYSSVSRKSI
jgi:argininosuccinate synthase